MRIGAAILGTVMGGVLLAGCSVGDIRQPPPTVAPATSAPTVAPPPVVGVPDSLRRVRIPVPGDFTQQAVEFGDAEHGYAQYVRCGTASLTGDRSCTAILLTTTDGGRTWQARRHPRPTASDFQLFAGPTLLALTAEPYGWYLSRDGGRSFAHRPGDRPPPEFAEVNGAGNAVTRGADGRLWRAGVRDGSAYAAVSTDRGRSWRPTAVPAPGGDLASVEVALSPDGRDAWLVGSHPDRAMFPRLWRMLDGDDAWQVVPAAGHPERYGFAVALGFGTLAVSGEPGAGLVGLDYRPAGWPVTTLSLRLLRDGTLISVDAAGGSILTGAGVGTRRVWTRTVLVRQ
jgi:hypothetical protein